MSVSAKSKEYIKYFPQWQLVRDCVEGSKTVKDAGSAYLPVPNSEDGSEENQKRYRDYKQRANFVNVTGSTKDGLLGMVFRKDPVIELSSQLEYMSDNANGNGLPLSQLVRDICGDVLETGRLGILVDYPAAPDNVTLAVQRALNLQANLLVYKAEDVISWRTEVIGNVSKLSLVVLQESVEEVEADGFASANKKQYRVLRLVNGTYIQQVYNEDEEVILQDAYNEAGDQLDYTVPTNAEGNSWGEIPFVFIGAQNNDETVDKSPLYDIAEVNVAHYRNSADYEESCFLVGQPTPVLTGLSVAWVKEVLGDKVMLGSRSAVALPANAGALLLQANPNTMPAEAMKAKESQMVRLGARLIEEGSTNETAEGARIRYGGQTSKLGTIVGNVEAALKKSLDYAAMFMGGSNDSKVELNKQFYDSTVDPQTIIAQIQLYDRAIIAKQDLRDNLRKVSLISSYRTDEAIDTDVENENPLSGGNANNE